MTAKEYLNQARHLDALINTVCVRLTTGKTCPQRFRHEVRWNATQSNRPTRHHS